MELIQMKIQWYSTAGFKSKHANKEKGLVNWKRTQTDIIQKEAHREQEIKNMNEIKRIDWNLIFI